MPEGGYFYKDQYFIKLTELEIQVYNVNQVSSGEGLKTDGIRDGFDTRGEDDITSQEARAWREISLVTVPWASPLK